MARRIWSRTSRMEGKSWKSRGVRGRGKRCRLAGVVDLHLLSHAPNKPVERVRAIFVKCSFDHFFPHCNVEAPAAQILHTYSGSGAQVKHVVLFVSRHVH